MFLNTCSYALMCFSSKNRRSTNSKEDMTRYPGMKAIQNPSGLELNETPEIILWPSTNND